MVLNRARTGAFTPAPRVLAHSAAAGIADAASCACARSSEGIEGIDPPPVHKIPHGRSAPARG